MTARDDGQIVAPYTYGTIAEKSAKLGYGLNPSDLAGKTLVPLTQALLASCKVLLVMGQSNAVSIDPASAYTPANSGVYNFDFYSHQLYAAADPLAGPEYVSGAGGSFVSRLGDQIVGSGLAPGGLIIVNLSIGSSHFGAWVGEKPLNVRIPTVIRTMKQNDIMPDWIIYHGGESDAILGESAATVQANIEDINHQIRSCNAEAPWFIGKSCYYDGGLPAGTSAVYSGIDAAIANNFNIFAGAFTDNLTTGSGHRQADGTHLNTAGLVATAPRWHTVIDNYES